MMNHSQALTAPSNGSLQEKMPLIASATDTDSVKVFYHVAVVGLAAWRKQRRRKQSLKRPQQQQQRRRLQSRPRIEKATPSTACHIDSIRHLPDIMVRVYSYLSLKDRVTQLATVDRTFRCDVVRAGITQVTYGCSGRLNDRKSACDAINEIKIWARQELKAFKKIEKAEKRIIKQVRRERRRRRMMRRLEEERQILVDRLEKVLRMEKKAQTVVSNSSIWWQCHHLQTDVSHFLVSDITSILEFRHRYGDDHDSLERLIKEERFEADFADYVKTKRSLKVQRKAYFSLPQPDGLWITHVMVRCSCCSGWGPRLSMKNRCFRHDQNMCGQCAQKRDVNRSEGFCPYC